MEREYRVSARVDLAAIRENLQSMAASHGGTGLMAVVKADAYGHGAVPVARAVADLVEFYAVATADEALELRTAGIRQPILLLGFAHESYYPELIAQEVRPCVYSLERARAMSACASALGARWPVHVKVDTGMGRLGFPVSEEGVEEAVEAVSLPGLVPEGIFTHYATADEADKTMTRLQTERYDAFVLALEERGIVFPIHHIANSAGILDAAKLGIGGVADGNAARGGVRRLARAGIAMYGCYPSDEVDRSRVRLRPALSLTSHIVHLKWMEPGSTISYGATCRLERRSRIATIPVGYGDGYPRSLSNCGYVLIRGCRAPVCGRVCMDQMMVDVTDIPEAALGDTVTLLGRDGGEEITAEALGSLSGRLHYEILCDLTKRVPRVYGAVHK